MMTEPHDPTDPDVDKCKYVRLTLPMDPMFAESIGLSENAGEAFWHAGMMRRTKDAAEQRIRHRLIVNLREWPICNVERKPVELAFEWETESGKLNCRAGFICKECGDE